MHSATAVLLSTSSLLAWTTSGVATLGLSIPPGEMEAPAQGRLVRATLTAAGVPAGSAVSLSLLVNGAVVETQSVDAVTMLPATGPGPHLFIFGAGPHFAIKQRRALRVNHPSVAIALGLRVCAHWSY